MTVESSKSKPVWKTQVLSNKEILRLHRKAILSFYLRPRYIFDKNTIRRILKTVVNSIKESDL